MSDEGGETIAEARRLETGASRAVGVFFALACVLGLLWISGPSTSRSIPILFQGRDNRSPEAGRRSS